jgi:hypothetical protein
MGFVHAHVALSNAWFPEVRPIEVDALIDSAAYLTCIPEPRAQKLAVNPAHPHEVKSFIGQVQAGK